MTFQGCRNVYPLRFIKPENRYKYNEQATLRLVFNSLSNSDVTLKNVICDNPKRSIVRNSLSHSSLYACEYCVSSAVSHVDENLKLNVENNITELNEELHHVYVNLDILNSMENVESQVELLEKMKLNVEKRIVQERKRIKKTHLTWPASTINGAPRTLANIRDISQAIVTGRNSDEESEELTRDERQGIVGPSVLLNYPQFNLIKNLPAEYMHSVCLGLVKRLLQLTFKVGDSRDKISKRIPTPPSMYNDLICNVRVPREFSRRCRQLDLSVFKAQEMRNVLLFFFPIIVQCIEPQFPNERKIWLLIAYCVRSCILPNNEFLLIDADVITQYLHEFYLLFEQEFGSKQCSYSVHVVSSHLLQIRGKNPLTFTSAFPFENFYAEMKQCFQPGTCSTLKQIFQNVFMKRFVEFHVCHTSLFFKHDKTCVNDELRVKQSKECNSLIYVFDNVISMYKIVSVHEDFLTCVKQGFFNAYFNEVPNLNWCKVGVFRPGPLGTEEISIPISVVSGKVINVLNFYITCPCNILREK